jgi:hypothetical protein
VNTFSNDIVGQVGNLPPIVKSADSHRKAAVNTAGQVTNLPYSKE